MNKFQALSKLVLGRSSFCCCLICSLLTGSLLFWYFHQHLVVFVLCNYFLVLEAASVQSSHPQTEDFLGKCKVPTLRYAYHAMKPIDMLKDSVTKLHLPSDANG